ncbi:MAG: gamma carbonic anhydrase family protein [Rhodospirillales bacterium]|nr:gamma carbonic anhydrase family protein [Rhodospirillales bacterium]
MKWSLGEDRVQGRDYWIAPTAVVVGKVKLGQDASIWWNSVLRGDNDLITIGDRCNIQDGCVLHTDLGFPLTLESDVTVGHMVMLHGCTVGSFSLIGIGSVVMNGAKIGRSSIVGARSLVTEGKEFPDQSLIIGSPARVLRKLTDEEAAGLSIPIDIYVRNWKRYQATLKLDQDA